MTTTHANASFIELAASYGPNHHHEGKSKAIGFSDCVTISMPSAKMETSFLLLGPLVLTTDLIFFFRGEVILNVESLPNLLRRLAFDHIGHSLAPNVKKRLDVEVVGGLRNIGISEGHSKVQGCDVQG